LLHQGGLFGDEVQAEARAERPLQRAPAEEGGSEGQQGLGEEGLERCAQLRVDALEDGDRDVDGKERAGSEGAVEVRVRS
jgi:hypothetical protein